MSDLEETREQNEQSDELRFAIPEKGYGVYLKGILPEDQRVLAGAFSVAMQQIKNIDQVQIEKFAQAAYSTENMFGLNLVNGTDVPTDQQLARIAQGVCALGGGVYGTFTMSNFFGAMSGLPYPLREIYDGIKQLETDKLKKIYQELYLATTWEAATFVVDYDYEAFEVGNTGSPDFNPIYDWRYKINSATMNNSGGGYTRDGAPDPTGDFVGNGYYIGSGGATLYTNPDRNVDNVPGTFGKMINLQTTSGSWVTYVSGTLDPTAQDPEIQYQLQAPPTSYSGYPYIGGSNNPYGFEDWPAINAAIMSYIDDANNEILGISTSSPTNFEASNILNTHWLITGKAMRQEQRARYIANSPVPEPKWDRWIANYPTTLYVFVDSIPTFAANTLPHMYSQTLENISDFDLVGGQSVVGLMRESRNQERLNRAGLVLENNLANDMSPQDKIQLITNGTLPGAVDGINGYTIPAFPGELPGPPNTIAIPVPVSYYDPCLPGMMCYNEIQYVENTQMASILAAPPPEPEPEVPESPTGYEPPPSPEILPSGADVVVPDTSFPCEGSVVDPIYGAKPAPVATAVVGTGAAVPCDPPLDYPTGVNGTSLPFLPIPGRGGGRSPKNIIPPELDAENTSSTMLPSAPTVAQAIDQVIKCNCDCWIA